MAKNTKEIEAVVKDASLNSLYEAILEAGPQLLIQMHIVLCTGEISTIQAISMGSSLLILTIAASRGFFVQRPKQCADPEPNPQMIFWVFLPMLILIVSAVINWSAVGLVKEYIAPIIGCCVGGTWIALWLRIFFSPVYASLRTLDSLYKQSRQPQQSRQSLQVLHWVNFRAFFHW